MKPRSQSFFDVTERPHIFRRHPPESDSHKAAKSDGDSRGEAYPTDGENSHAGTTLSFKVKLSNKSKDKAKTSDEGGTEPSKDSSPILIKTRSVKERKMSKSDMPLDGASDGSSPSALERVLKLTQIKREKSSDRSRPLGVGRTDSKHQQTHSDLANEGDVEKGLPRTNTDTRIPKDMSRSEDERTPTSLSSSSSGIPKSPHSTELSSQSGGSLTSSGGSRGSNSLATPGARDSELVQNPILWSNPDKAGYLVKQGIHPGVEDLHSLTDSGHIMRNWKSRWFVLKNNLLFYFKSSQELGKPVGVMNLSGVLMSVDRKLKRSNLLRLYSPSTSYTLVVQVLLISFCSTNNS